MTLCAAQFNPSNKSPDEILNIHMELIEKAGVAKVDFIQFPEMSLSGYQREKANSLAFMPGDKRLDPFRVFSRRTGMIISMGAPVSIENKLYIGNFIITPGGDKIYMKQHLHPGEEIYFDENAAHSPRIEMNNQKIGFAVCFDIENRIHWEKASSEKTDIYSVGIFYSPGSMPKLHSMAAGQSAEYNMNVVISNFCIGSYGMEAGGGSGIWSRTGENVVLLDSSSTGLAIAEKQKGIWKGKAIYGDFGV